MKCKKLEPSLHIKENRNKVKDASQEDKNMENGMIIRKLIEEIKNSSYAVA